MIGTALTDQKNGSIGVLTNTVQSMAEQQTRILAALEAGGTIRPATTETTSAFARLRHDYTGNNSSFPPIQFGQCGASGGSGTLAMA